MELAAIYNTWGDVDLLKLSIENIRPLVDVVIVVISRQSNYGEKFTGPDGSMIDFGATDVPIFFIQMEPNLSLPPMANETNKRNYGLDFARRLGCTHFLTMDADEFYEHEPFLKHKRFFSVDPNLKGIVCQCMTYFKSPTLTIGLDVTLVPFIHELTPTIKHAFNRNYPFAWDKIGIRIDPTRSLNINSGVEFHFLTMHHMSWVRDDYERKIRNSSARANLERSTIRQDLVLAEEGKICNYYGKTLVRVPNLFNIPEYGEFLRKDIQPISAASTPDKPNL